MAYAPRTWKISASTPRRQSGIIALKTSSGRGMSLPLHVQILNEPVYTDYALPRQFGYAVKDYVKLLQVAHDAMKQVDPCVQVVGGISTG